MGEIGRTIAEEEKQGLTSYNKETSDEKENLQKEEQENGSEEQESTAEKASDGQKEKDVSDSQKKMDDGDVNIVSLFNKKYEKEFNSEDEIKALFEKADKATELESSSEELKKKVDDYKKIADGVNPLNYFANKDEYIRQQFLIKNKEKFDDSSLGVLSGLSPEKINNLKEVDALTTDLMVNDGLTSEEANAYISDKYNIDDVDEELDAGTRAKLKMDVRNAKSRLSKLYDGIDVPEKVDLESAREQLEASWQKPLSETVKSLDKIQLEDGVDFVIDDEMKSGIEEELMSELVSNGIKPSEEALGDVIGKIKDRIVLHNMDKVVKSMKADLTEQIKAEFRKEVHNDKSLQDDGKAPTGSVKSRDRAILDAWK